MKPLDDSLHDLVTANMGLVWKIVLKWKRSGLDLDDLAQAGTLGLMKAAAKYDSEKGQFSTYATWWIRSTVARAAEKAMKHAGLASLDAMDEDAPDKAGEPARNLIGDELYSKVWAAVDKLPAKDRETILLRYRAGLSQSETGGKLGVTRARAYQREARALATLREVLAG